MGDYASAELYWNKSCEVRGQFMFYYRYKYTAKKGDFLYRMHRYEGAIATYEKSLKQLKSLKDNWINTEELRYYAKVIHFITESYERLGKDRPQEKNKKELEHAANRFIRATRRDDQYSAHMLSETAWQLYEEDNVTDEALVYMDYAIRIHPQCPANYYNMKAIMLEDNFRYEEAIEYYNIAINKDKSNEILRENKAICKARCIIEKLKAKISFKQIKPHDFDLINEALEILPKDYDNSPYLRVKGNILFELGEPVKGKIFSALSVGNYDEVDKAEKQLKKLKSSETYINITGIQYYRNFEPFKKGTFVSLIKEPENPHDRDAIRVEIEGETVGYVANNKYTLINEVKSATDIKDVKSTQAEVQFILLRKWVIAKLI